MTSEVTGYLLVSSGGGVSAVLLLSHECEKTCETLRANLNLTSDTNLAGVTLSQTIQDTQDQAALESASASARCLSACRRRSGAQALTGKRTLNAPKAFEL